MTPHMRYLAGRLGKRGDAADANPNQKCRLVPGGAGSPLRGWYHHEGDQRGASRGPSGEREARGGHSSRLVFGDSGRGLVIRSRVKASSNLLPLLPIYSGKGGCGTRPWQYSYCCAVGVSVYHPALSSPRTRPYRHMCASRDRQAGRPYCRFPDAGRWVVVEEPAASLWAPLRSVMAHPLRPPAGGAYCRLCATCLGRPRADPAHAVGCIERLPGERFLSCVAAVHWL